MADAAGRVRLEQEATDAAALADVLDTRARQLEAADEARALWLVHTAETRAAADRARLEISARDIASGRPEEELTTAEEWLAAQAEAQRVEDPHRQVTDEADLADVTAQRDTDVRTAEAEPHADAAETGVPDIRDLAAAEPRQVAEDVVRVPTADETAAAVARAQRALAELDKRRAIEERRAAEEARAAQVARWHADDLRTGLAAQREADRADSVGFDGGPVLELSTPLD